MKANRGDSLEGRLVALREAVELGRDVLPADALGAAEEVLARAGQRLGHGVDHTVVALAGATGSGKSTLFNALAGAELSTVGVRRPTTSVTHAASWGDPATGLLDWLAVPQRHQVGGGPLDGLVLLDLPDHDSTRLEHRAEVDRVVGVADVVVWVVDPQKYADASLHERYLRPLAGHAGVLLVVLHQADRLSPADLAACRADLLRLLRDDGLEAVTVLTTSARTGAGLDQLRAALAERVQARQLAVERLGADVGVVARRWAAWCPGDERPARSGPRRDELVAALAEAAGVATVAGAVAGSHRARAIAATGWPATRWLRRLRPDPLRRLHLGRGPQTSQAARTSLPAAGPAARARLDTALRGLADSTSAHLSEPWADAARRVTTDRAPGLAARLDRAVAGTDLRTARAPVWWSVVGALQVVLAVMALVGAGWLAVLAALSSLRIGDLGTPDLGALPVPTAMLGGGVLAGLAVAAVARAAAGVGARRRARRARAALAAAVAHVADEELLAPSAQLVERAERWCAAVAVAAGEAPRRR